MLIPLLIVRGGPPRLGEMVAIACLSLAVATEVICAATPPPPSDGDLDGLNWAQGLALLVGFELELLWGWHSASLLAGAAGVATMLAGTVLRGLAIRTLGGGFTNTSRPATAGLCVSGIYARLRHPAEAGLLLIAAGFAAVAGAWQAMAVVLPLLLVLSALRIRHEERGLARAFPESFDAYRLRVRF